MTPTNPVATTPFGRLVGRCDGDLNVFRGVRYAQPPVGPRRFAKPAPLPLSEATIDAGADGAIPPQLPSRLEIAMGPTPVRRARTVSASPSGRRPISAARRCRCWCGSMAAPS